MQISFLTFNPSAADADAIRRNLPHAHVRRLQLLAIAESGRVGRFDGSAVAASEAAALAALGDDSSRPQVFFALPLAFMREMLDTIVLDAAADALRGARCSCPACLLADAFAREPVPTPPH